MTHLRLPVVDPSAALVVRTDRTDPAAWQRLLAELRRLPTTPLHLVDDPGWADAGPLTVLASAAGQEDISVVFLADRRTMRSPTWPCSRSTPPRRTRTTPRNSIRRTTRT